MNKITLGIGIRIGMVLVLCSFTGAFAESSDATATNQTTAAAASPNKFFGQVEVRPSWTTKLGEEHTQNTLEAGYQFGNVKVSYVQWFNTNIYNPTDAPVGAGASGLGLIASDGLFRVKVKDLWKSQDKKTGLSFQGRIYTPTYSGARDAGMLTLVKTYLTISREISPVVSMDLSLVPVYFGYTRAGTPAADASAKPTANPVYENLVILNADFKVTEKLTLSLPVIFQQTRYRDFSADAANNNAWASNCWLWPELNYEINSMHTLGVALYTGNLAVAQNSGMAALESGLHDTTAQIFWTVNL